ncbi:uracil-DNA glycosylase [Porphyromonas gingivalis]|uniref:uracil-DNA glycosylase n=1 Tax=Porphyromonas gingivalis TaxID=837 RepID=UPI000C18293D|nr:uracil-DNA glycosylase [Porphyromonas gingivalis]ATS04015.1 uracil-DNA glycosylase [Porphyromonas gingivalis]MCE8181282.1 uracil-DNA glycosylase [Porphyromonas gingivalis]
MKEVRIEAGWKKVLQEEFDKFYFEKLTDFVREEYRQSPIYPPARFIFRAFDTCPFDRVKVVILGQDPYHEPGQAEGLAFSVPTGIPIPPSLRNICEEIRTDTGQPAHIDGGSLLPWVEQGVLLLNATLTVRASQAGSHQGHGWETFTDAAIEALAKRREHLVFLLWGSYARRKSAMIDPRRHLILEAPHPSPLSAHRGFFGCKHFSRTNAYLRQYGIAPIVW